jgi:general secretion pathway protein D
VRRMEICSTALRCVFLGLVPALLWVSAGAQEPEERRAPAHERSEGYINFNFEQVDVRAFVKLVGDITGKKFVVADDVKGKITVVAPRIGRREAYPLFVSILESVGCSVIEDGEVYRVVALAPRATPMAPVIGADEQTPALGVVTKIIRLKHVSAGEIRKLLESKVSGGKSGAVGAIEETNHLVITDTADSIRRIEKIIVEIDQPGMARTMEVVTLKHAGAEDMAGQLTQAVAEGASRSTILKRRLPAVPGSTGSDDRTAVAVAVPHSNSLILVGSSAQIQELKKIVAVMDVESQLGRGRLNAIFLKYLSAEEAAKSIKALLSEPAGKDGTAPRMKGIAIEASVVNNALLVDATPGDFDVVKQLVDQLDQVPQQVHIEVVIAQVILSDELNLGVEMAVLELPSGDGSTVIQGSSTFSDTGADSLMNIIQQGLFPRGITVGVGQGVLVNETGELITSFPGMINLDAVRKKGTFKISSHTSLEAQDNKEASVSIVDEIPILKSTVEGGSGTARDIIQNIERVEVGIKLKLTPHVIPGGQVQMVLNPSIEAVMDPGPVGTAFAPTIARREVSTTVTVPDGRTIVIAGLTREDRTKVVRKLPILGSIPILGVLFRHTVDSTEKTNMLIFVTPHIVGDMAKADQVRQDWEERTGLEAEASDKR